MGGDRREVEGKREDGRFRERLVDCEGGGWEKGNGITSRNSFNKHFSYASTKRKS